MDETSGHDQAEGLEKGEAASFEAAAPPGASAGAGDAADGAAGPLAGASLALDSLVDVPLRITVELGSSRMLVREVLQLNRGSVLPLDRSSGDPADILVNGRLIAKGEVTVVDDKLAIRVVELVSREAAGGSG